VVSNILRNKVSLNAISHDSAINLIKRTLAKGIKLAEVFIDTVGPPAKYQAKLQHMFPEIKSITVSKKADSLFPIVSAASICAKVTRDYALRRWVMPEQGINVSTVFGSGYPSGKHTLHSLSFFSLAYRSSD
jgi:ribonuclease H2 subunit A